VKNLRPREGHRHGGHDCCHCSSMTSLRQRRRDQLRRPFPSRLTIAPYSSLKRQGPVASLLLPTNCQWQTKTMALRLITTAPSVLGGGYQCNLSASIGGSDLAPFVSCCSRSRGKAGDQRRPRNRSSQPSPPRRDCIFGQYLVTTTNDQSPTTTLALHSVTE